MIIPVRCVTCGKVVGDKWRWFQRRLGELDKDLGETTDQEKNKKASLMDEAGLRRMCCRRHLLTTVDVMDKI
jgi:DNA-directed RNA polymerase subunit N (RpoN/RPB10)